MPRRPMRSGLAARLRSPAGLGAALLLLAALSLGPGYASARPPEAKTRPPPAGSVRFTRSYGWLPADERRLVLWAGVEEPYLVDLAAGCRDLRQAGVSGLTTHDRRLVPRTDTLTVDGLACPIERIQPAAESKLRSLGLRREDARPLPILPQPAAPTPPPRKTP
jgi:uncharacterized protein DUF6491